MNVEADALSFVVFFVASLLSHRSTESAASGPQNQMMCSLYSNSLFLHHGHHTLLKMDDISYSRRERSIATTAIHFMATSRPRNNNLKRKPEQGFYFTCRDMFAGAGWRSGSKRLFQCGFVQM